VVVIEDKRGASLILKLNAGRDKDGEVELVMR
jgi:hypothetical protein